MSGRRAAAAASRTKKAAAAAFGKTVKNVFKASITAAAGASAYAGTMHTLGAKHPIHGASNASKAANVSAQKAVNKPAQMKGGTRRKNRKARKTVRR
jgi:hypothetical protein